ncbi:alkaline phosphatase D family protein [Nocardioides kribbensis]|uniref:alkaline phosphatase D family protein n=1 Tax=Nocardioides kribbensis TaxID=305517 RepID=UPI0018791017|nr:alkaline phosphatase D family protein [Nocardioides kribbensis]
MTELVLGPLLRHVDETSATIWVETSDATSVTVSTTDEGGGAGPSAQARTWRVHGHHYALVELTGLQPGSRSAYTVSLDGAEVWPPPETPQEDSVIGTLLAGRPLHLLFGSCRVAVPHDEEHHESFGVDSLRTFGLHLIRHPEQRRPDLMMFLGDQVYADETSESMRDFIAARRDPDQDPGWELQDYEEYAELYRLAWSDPANRWLLSTVPSAMIFDDHDIRDDWNTSVTWRRDMEATSWWKGRIVGGLASYWVYQHLGNLDAAGRAEDRVWQLVAGHEGPEELDLTQTLDELADLADREPTTYRWSYARTFDTQARLVVVDSRAARVLEPQLRSIIDDEEMAWLDSQMRGDVDHLLVGTSLPFLMAPGLHHTEAVVEAVAEGVWGKHVARLAEKLRRAVDIEHWAAFQDGFRKVGLMAREVAAGERGRAPVTVTFLSGDVHHSYLARAWPDPRAGVEARSRIVQAVCSPIRNPLPTVMRLAFSLGVRGKARPRGWVMGRRTLRSPLHWEVTDGPWFTNLLATLDVRPGGLSITWSTGEVRDGDHDRPVWRAVSSVDV